MKRRSQNQMIKTLLREVKEFKKPSILTPFFMILEVLMETIIPFLMASIIDEGVEAGDIGHIYRVGAVMIAAAVIGLLAGLAGGRTGALASAGLAKNLRDGMFHNIQSFSFSNIDKFSTAGLVTRLTTDVTNIQHALCYGHGVFYQCETGKHLSDRRYCSWNYFDFYYEPCDKIFSAGISEV